MREAERQTRSHLMSRFEAEGLHPRSDLGQNFLIDLNLLFYIVQEADLGPDDVVLEIGSGTGGMTAFLAQQAGGVVSVEIDPRIFPMAQEAVAGCKNVTLLNCDALRNKNHLATVVLDALQKELAKSPDRRIKLIANLPYCIATPVMSNLMASELPWALMVVTIQWELALRMKAQPGTSDYSALSVWLQAQSEVQILKKLGPKVFWPRPGVDSAIVQIIPDPERRAALRNRAFFQDFIRRLFHQRRKQLRSVLAGMYRKELSKPEIDAVLGEFPVPEGVRAEVLDVPTLVALGNRMYEKLEELHPGRSAPETSREDFSEPADDGSCPAPDTEAPAPE